VGPDSGESTRSARRRFRPWTWFSLWCLAGAAVAVAVGGTAGAALFGLFAVVALFLFAVIARSARPPASPARPELPDPASAPLVFVVRGRTDMFATLRVAAILSVELVGEETWSLKGLEWHRIYAVRVPPGDYELRLLDPRGYWLTGNTEVLDVTLIPDGRLFVEYRRKWSLVPRGTLNWHPSVPDGVCVDEVINAKKELRH
jgi:hypothetical protein